MTAPCSYEPGQDHASGYWEALTAVLRLHQDLSLTPAGRAIFGAAMRDIARYRDRACCPAGAYAGYLSMVAARRTFQGEGLLVTADMVEEAAAGITGSMIEAARTSGDEPVVFVTGNRYVPALRSYPQAEFVWQHDDTEFSSQWQYLCDLVENRLAVAEVYIGYVEDDNSIYVVDMRRWQAKDEFEDAETYSDEWEAREDGHESLRS